MYSDDLMKDFEAYLPTLTKTNEFALAQFEKLAAFQFNAFQSYMELGINQWQAALAIRDIDGLRDFWMNQLDASAELSQKMLKDGQSFSEMLLAISTEAGELVGETASKAATAVHQTGEAVVGNADKAASAVTTTTRKRA